MQVLGPTGIDLNASRPLAAFFPRVLSLLNRAPSGFKAQYCIFEAMGCCGSTATVPSEPPPSTPASNRTAHVPMPSQTSQEMTPIPSSQPLARRRSRTGSRPESSSRTYSQDSNTRSRTKSAPQPPPAPLKASSSQGPRARAETLTAPKRSNRPDSRPPMPGEFRG